MQVSYFTPRIAVDDHEHITIDFSDSYVYTVDTSDDVTQVENEGRHSTFLDSVLGMHRVTTPKMLRRLADYIEKQES